MSVRISIVTICFNNLQDLQRTCASVDAQELHPFEHLIVDGSTNKEIVDWLTQTAQPLYRRWLHERDKGIADAFNKGIQHSKGEIIYLLNSGDELYDASVLNRVTQTFETHPHIQWCHGKLQLLRGGMWVIVGKPFEKNKLYRGMRAVFHPTMYVRREVYERRGLFDTHLRIAMDYDFLCRLADEPFYFIGYPLARFDPTGVSTTNYMQGMQES